MKKMWLRRLSILVELVIATLLSIVYSPNFTLLYVAGLVDISLEKEDNHSFDFMSVIYGAACLISCYMLHGSEMTFQMLCILGPVYILTLGLRSQSSGKKQAQDLYDELRNTETKLRIANQDLKAYSSTIEELTVLRERNRISREIHDNVGHALSTMIIQLDAISVMAVNAGEQASAMAKNLATFARKSLEEVRQAVRAIKPVEYEEYEGIIIIKEMLDNFHKMTGIQIDTKISEIRWKINSDQATAIYHMIQEFLSNSVRHGKADKVMVVFNFTEDDLRIYLKDNGIGCDQIDYGIGLKSIRERAHQYGGTVEYNSSANHGFEAIIHLVRGKRFIDETNESE